VKWGLPPPKGQTPLNIKGFNAARAAADILDPSVRRCQAHLSLFPGDRDIYGSNSLYNRDYDCPWRQELKLSLGGTWHKLSLSLYEAVTGEVIDELFHYCRKLDEHYTRLGVRTAG
jgi:hypothetical protein